MSLNSEAGPHINIAHDSESKPADIKDLKLTCISPYLLDVVYKIVYSAPWS